MPVAPSASIHPTAIVSTEADIADGVRVGPYTVIDGAVAIGRDSTIGPHVHLIGDLRMGERNVVSTGVVIGAAPQHLSYREQPTRTEIGDDNTFREHVTIHRGSHVEGLTRIGSNNYFMAHAHVAHDCKVGNHCVMVNGALMAGHCELHDRATMSGNAAIHQFSRMGRLSFLHGLESSSKDVPPFFVVKNRFQMLGVNVVGMKRSGISSADILVVKQAFHILYRSNLMLKLAVEKLEADHGTHPLVREILEFIRTSKRGLFRSGGKGRTGDED